MSKDALTAQSARDAIRTGFFANKTARKTLTLSSGLKIEVRQPTVGEQLAYGQMDDTSTRILRLFVDHVFVPDTEDKVFEEADVEALKSQPSAGDYSDILEALTSVMNVSKGVDAARKN